MFCTRTRSCARADDAIFVRSRNAQCKTRESPQLTNLWCEENIFFSLLFIHVPLCASLASVLIG